MHVFDIYNNEIAYYKTPKCGSRTILAWAALIKEPNLILEHPEWFAESRRAIEYKEIRQRVNRYKNITHNQKIKFCIVRDPVERFISAFTNRILFHQKPQIHITITDFIKNIDTLLELTSFKDAKIHFATQVQHIGSNPNVYTHIFDIKKLNEVKSLLENHIDISLPDLHLQKSGNIIRPTLTEEQKNVIKNRYKIDYEIYGGWFV